ncbi:MAG: hypothetical protein ACTSU5_02180 [Promethearchaeota archaeon]
MSSLVILLFFAVRIAVLSGNALFIAKAYKHYSRTRILGILYLLLVLNVLAILYCVLMSVFSEQWGLLPENPVSDAILFTIPGFLGFFGLSFVEYYTKDQFDKRKLAFCVFILGGAFFGNIFLLFERVPLYNIPSAILLVLIAVWILQALGETKRNVIDPLHVRQVNIFAVGIVVSFIFSSVFMSVARTLVAMSGESTTYLVFKDVLHYLSIVVGSQVVAYSFFSYPRVSFIMPYRVYALMVVGVDGVAKYNHEVFKLDSYHHGLVSGAIGAVTGIMQESLGTSSTLEEIRLGDRVAMVHEEKEHAFVLFAEQSTKYFWTGLRTFAGRFVETYADQLEDWKGDLLQFKGADAIFKYAFGL